MIAPSDDLPREVSRDLPHPMPHDVSQPLRLPSPPPASRGPFWRVLQLIAGAALFLYALRVLAPLPLARLPFVLLAALLAAGAMALADSAVGILAAIAGALRGGRRS